ncbi:MAG TPA: glutamate racemase [Phycisphaerae bacterium]|nr:glutamate racemase [Phycisphaerae bacterium]
MSRPIGIFDSGLGGLTVVRAIRRHLPAESIVYFGDTARVPYGIKSGRTVTRFAAEDCEFLVRHDPKFIVAACNTASAAALPALQERFAVPLCGVIEPGAAEAVRVGRARPIGIIATEATVASGAYRRAILALAPDAALVEQACPLLVPLVEEGRSPGDRLVRLALEEYLAPLGQAGVGTVVLGCTHYPLLADAIAEVLGPDVALVDSAEAVAREVASRLAAQGAAEADGPGEDRFFVSDNPERFREVGARFLGEPVKAVSQVTPEEFFAESHVTAAGAEDVS